MWGDESVVTGHCSDAGVMGSQSELGTLENDFYIVSVSSSNHTSSFNVTTLGISSLMP